MSSHALTSTFPPPVRPEPERWEYSLQVPNDPRACRIVRHTLRDVLREHHLPGLIDTAELLTSELVTNAVRYSGHSVLVLMRTIAQVFRVSVWDANPTDPRAVPHRPYQTFGRGLHLVHQLADDWGHYNLGSGTAGTCGGSKVIWFECATD